MYSLCISQLASQPLTTKAWNVLLWVGPSFEFTKRRGKRLVVARQGQKHATLEGTRRPIWFVSRGCWLVQEVRYWRMSNEMRLKGKDNAARGRLLIWQWRVGADDGITG